MNFTMKLPGLKGVTIEDIVEQENRILVYITIPVKEHICPACGEKTTKIHDYRMRKIGHLPMWGRKTELMYKFRRYRLIAGNDLLKSPHLSNVINAIRKKQIKQ